MRFDIRAARRRSNYSAKQQFGRLVWFAASRAFRLSPHPCFRFRRNLLRCLGAKIGPGTRLANTVAVHMPWNLSIGEDSSVGDGATLYCLGPVRLGDRVTVSQGAYLCAGTHDYQDPAMPLLKVPIQVESDSWICAQAFLGPGIRVGRSTVVGARAVVMKSLPAGVVAVGNPAQVVKQRTA